MKKILFFCLLSLFLACGLEAQPRRGGTGVPGRGGTMLPYLDVLGNITLDNGRIILSDDDVAHGVTTLTATDVFGDLSVISGTVGGLLVTGLADATGIALQLKGVQSADPTDTTPAISLIATKASGTGVADLGAAETLFQVANNDNAAAMTILGNNRVGLGTATPANALTVAWAGADTDPTGFASDNPYIGIVNSENATDNNFEGILFSLTDSNSAVRPVAGIFGINIGHTAAAPQGDLSFVVRNGGTIKQALRIDKDGNVGIGNTAPAGVFVVNPPAAQTIAAGNTITANACGTIKQITAAGAVTTDTTDTFTAPAAANSGCCMDVINTGANAITLDANANFVSAGAADVVLGAGDTCRVCSSGASGKWYQIGDTGNN